MGVVIFPIMVYPLIAEAEFGWTMRAVVFLILAGLVIVNLTVKSRLTHTPKPFHLGEYIRPFQELPFALLVTSLTFFSFGLFLPLNFLVLEAQSHRMSAELANYVLAILNAASVFGRILPGLLADKVGRFNTMAVCASLSGILTLAVWLPVHTDAAIICYAAFFGFCSGGYVSLTPALVAQVSPISEIEVRNGALYFFVSIPVLTGTLIDGALYSSDAGSYSTLKIFAGVMMCAGAVIVFPTRTYLVGFTYKAI